MILGRKSFIGDLASQEKQEVSGRGMGASPPPEEEILTVDMQLSSQNHLENLKIKIQVLILRLEFSSCSPLYQGLDEELWHLRHSASVLDYICTWQILNSVNLPRNHQTLSNKLQLQIIITAFVFLSLSHPIIHLHSQFFSSIMFLIPVSYLHIVWKTLILIRDLQRACYQN